MFKKFIRVIVCISVLIYVIAAPYYLNNVYVDKYLKEDPENDWSGVITMWDIPRMNVNGSEFGWINSRISAYNKANPDVYVEIRELHYEDNKDIAFHAALEDDYPDIMPLFIDNYVMPLDNVSTISNIGEGDVLLNIREDILNSVLKDGEVWAIPIYYSVNVIIVNIDILDSLDIKVEKEYNFQDFNTFLKSIENNGNNEIIPFDFYIDNGSYSFMPFLLSDSESFLEQGQIFQFLSDDVIAGLQKINIIKSNLNSLPDDFGLRSRKKVMDDFLGEKTAVIAGNLDDVNSVIRSQNRGKGFNYTIIPYPNGKSNNTLYFADEICCYAAMRTEDPEKMDAIHDFLKFLLNEESQNSLESIGKLPVIDVYEYSYEKYDHLKELNSEAIVNTIPFTVNRNVLNDTINDELKRMFSANRTTTETLYNIKENLNNALKMEQK